MFSMKLFATEDSGSITFLVLLPLKLTMISTAYGVYEYLVLSDIDVTFSHI